MEFVSAKQLREITVTIRRYLAPWPEVLLSAGTAAITTQFTITIKCRSCTQQVVNQTKYLIHDIRSILYTVVCQCDQLAPVVVRLVCSSIRENCINLHIISVVSHDAFDDFIDYLPVIVRH